MPFDRRDGELASLGKRGEWSPGRLLLLVFRRVSKGQAEPMLGAGAGVGERREEKHRGQRLWSPEG